MFKKTLLALSLAGFAAFAQAADTPAVESSTSSEFTDDRFYVAPFGTFIQTGGDRNANAGWGGGMAFGKIINEYFNVEIKGFWNGWNHNGGVDGIRAPGVTYRGGRSDYTGGTVDLQYYFMRDDFSPYVVFAVGGANTSRRNHGDINGNPVAWGRSSAGFVFEAGAGATYELADNFLLRADARYRGTTAQGLNTP